MENFLDIQALNKPANVGFSKASDEQLATLPGLPVSKTENMIKEFANTETKAAPTIMSQEEFFSKVDNAIASGDFEGETEEQIYNGLLNSITSDGITIDGIYNEEPEIIEEVEVPEEEIAGFDVGVKTGEAVSNFGKNFKFESNVDDGVIESGLKFLGNLPGNTVQIAGDLISIASNPLGTAKSIKTLATAGIETGLNKLFIEEGHEVFTTEEIREVSNAVGQELSKLGEPGKIKELLIENPADVLFSITGGLGIAKNIAKTKGLTGLVSKLEVAEKLTNPIKLQAEALKTVGKGISKVGEGIGFGATKLTGMNFDTVKTIVKNPELFKSAEKGELTRQTVADDVIQAIDKKASEISDIGSKYEDIRKLKANVTTNDVNKLKSNINKTLADSDITVENGILNFDNSQIGQTGNRKAIQDAYNLVNNRTKFDKGGDWLNLRQSIDDTINYKSEATTRGETIVNGIRGEVDNIAKDKLTGLKELDQTFGPERNEFNRINKLIRNKDGGLKDNYIAIVDNITGKGKELKLERLKKIIPNIDEQVNALKALEDVEVSGGNKVGAYAAGLVLGGGTLGVGTGGAAIVPAIATYILTRPKTLVNVLKAYNVAAKTITGISNKVKNGIKLTKAEAKVVGGAIKEQALEKGADLVDDLADKVGARSKLMQDTGKSLDDFNKVGTTKSAEAKTLKEAIKQSPANIGFHGTNVEFDKFLESKIGQGATSKYGKGVYLSSSPEVAKTYADLLGGLKGGKPRLLEVVIPDDMKIKTYEGPITGLKEAGEVAKKEGFKGVKFNTERDFIQIPGARNIDTTGHNNYIIFNPNDAKIISNNVIKEIGFVKGAGLIRDLLAGSIVGLSAIEIGLMLKDKFFPQTEDTEIQGNTTPRG